MVGEQLFQGSIRKLRNALDGWVGWGVATPRYFCVTLLPKPLVFALRDGWGGQKFAFLALRNLRTLPKAPLTLLQLANPRTSVGLRLLGILGKVMFVVLVREWERERAITGLTFQANTAK